MSIKNPLIRGTIILTIAGFASRFIGFFYRIFLSQAIGAKGMGIYQLIFPIHGFCFSLCTASIQTAISRYVAVEAEKNPRSGRRVLAVGLTVSLVLSCLCTFVIYSFSDFIAVHLLFEPRCSYLLQIMALTIPVGSVHSCICGYYLGLQNASVSGWSQLFEQIIRVCSVILIATVLSENGRGITPSLAVFGMLFGEIASMIYCMLYYYGSKTAKKKAVSYITKPLSYHKIFILLMSMSIPLTLNRVMISLLQSVEASFIPLKLREFGLSTDAAISIYGVLTGMSLTFILFPSAVTNSIAVMLLPSVSKAQAHGSTLTLKNSITLCTRFCLWIGLLCTGVFLVYGKNLGTILFHNQEAGIYIQILSWLCPFLYLSTTFGSILNGCGKTSITFLQNAAALVVRILFIWFAIPRYGIIGYLWGLLVSQLFLTLLYYVYIQKLLGFLIPVWQMITRPLFLLFFAVGIGFSVQWLVLYLPVPKICSLFSAITCTCGLFGGVMWREFRHSLFQSKSNTP